jgi:CheY-like chemotaxis protein
MDPLPVKPRTYNILLGGTLYDEFTLEEAGFRTPEARPSSLPEEDLLTGLWLQQLEMDNVFWTAESASDTLNLLSRRKFDIVICDTMLGHESSIGLSRKIKSKYPETRLVLLTSSPQYQGPKSTWPQAGAFDLVLTWHGNVQLLRSIVLLYKDGRTMDRSDDDFRPRVVMLVEDEPGLAGLYLPLIHEEIFDRTREILPEKPAGDLLVKILFERPRLLYATTYEEAVEIVNRWGEDLLGVITDVQFNRDGEMDTEAGFELTRFIRRLYPTLSIAIQSRDPDIRNMARALNARFLHKEPMTLLSKLKHFMIDYLGFGPFIFRMPDGNEVARAGNIRELARAFEEVPLESFLYHAGNNHYSAWLSLHGHRTLARQLAPLKAFNERDRLSALKLIRAYIDEVYPDRCEFF